ncbi:hypothetical protein KAFR_0H00460 [Kazachstania africana CBS 2517]|uniref:TIGR01456 family HAD hydrolase n=1 Tax=Kazachstania africana (strain ATCC 22294 / BCRC 22015 / CBS 2517 / CECT 1963 / NBRC 1671 / NRRL Y-8276) TaxID=1071382 RepID=H2AYP9_KAZAF|nr:hypothetical protein KAFR_0H00460 [Kazachstania africana CBS 2517]CCF59455.1 hypothetical protein KAFR_0H00460 [Kazachstania africana CBS 2517]
MTPRRALCTASKPIGFVFDIDGVLLRGKNPIPSASKALSLLNDIKIPYILLTNGGGKLETERAKALSRTLNVEISPLQIVQCHTPFKTLANKFDRVLAVGTPSVREVAEAYGFKDVVHQYDIVRYNKNITPFSALSREQLMQYSKEISNLDTKRFDAILVFNDPLNWAADIQIMCDLLNSQNGMLNTVRKDKSETPSIPIFFSNKDLLWSNAYNLNRFGQGAFRLLVRKLYCETNNGKPLIDFVTGKPTKLTYDFAHHLLIRWRDVLFQHSDGSPATLPELGIAPKNSPFTDVFMVGDNPASDIAGAINYGWSTCLVKTGVYREGDCIGENNPTMTVSDVHEAVTNVLNRYV